MHHDDDADGARRQPPRVLEGESLLLRVGILERDVEHLREVLTQVMRRRRLEWNEAILEYLVSIAVSSLILFNFFYNAINFYFLCLLDKTVKAFYLVSMPVEVKYPSQGVNV